jgi:hypothetical protein
VCLWQKNGRAPSIRGAEGKEDRNEEENKRKRE